MQSQLHTSAINSGYCFRTKKDCLQHTERLFAQKKFFKEYEAAGSFQMYF